MSQKTTLNPSATEFVPNFVMPNMSSLSLNDKNTEEQKYSSNEQTQYQNNYHHQQHNNGGNYYHQSQQQQPQQRFYGQNHNTSHRHSYNPNYRGNNYRHNHRNNNYNNHHHYNQQHQQHNYYQQQQNYDVDPFELEARCEAVVEILQDEKVRDQLNPSANNNEGNNNIDNGNDPNLDDEEELAEMLAMQEECRLEMMKFYIQSQNPTLFEELYHDVSYPESSAAKLKAPEEELLSPKAVNVETETDNSSEAPKNTLRDLIINELNPEVAEFVPNKFADEEKECNTQTN